MLEDIHANRIFHIPRIQDLPLPAVESSLFRRIDVLTNTKLNFHENVEQKKNVQAVKGLWSREEDEHLKTAIEGMNPIVWDVVAEKVPGRNAIQCRERWRYRLCPDVKKSRFESWEDAIILLEQKRIGNRWTVIANKLPGRTACAVKNRWYSVLRNVCSE